jgi:hypothetical protein
LQSWYEPSFAAISDAAWQGNVADVMAWHAAGLFRRSF